MRKKHLVVGFSMIAIGLVLVVTLVSSPYRHWESPQNPDMAPIYKWLFGIPLILAGIPFVTAGFVKRIGKMTLVITTVLLFSVWYLFVVSRGS